MAFRVILFVLLAIFVFWFTEPTKQEDNGDDDNKIDFESKVCKSKVKTSDGILAYTKDCLGYSKEAMDCVREFINRREKDPFPIAIECTPNLPETLKQILRQLLNAMNVKREVESRCKMDHSTVCSNELLIINKKHDEVVDRYMNLRETRDGLGKIANAKFISFVFNVAGVF